MKTGTTTLNRALSILGYRVSHNSWRWLSHVLKEEWEEIRRKTEEWDALEDNPIPLLYERLDALFPGSKFILSIRDEDAWYRSVSHHIGDLRSPMHEWLFGLSKGLPKDDEAHTRAVYRAHIERVKAYFADRPDDLLILDVTHCRDWEALCRFLNQPVPDLPFPHANKTDFTRSNQSSLRMRWKRLKKRLSHAIALSYYRYRGWIPVRDAHGHDPL